MNSNQVRQEKLAALAYLNNELDSNMKILDKVLNHPKTIAKLAENTEISKVMETLLTQQKATNTLISIVYSLQERIIDLEHPVG